MEENFVESRFKRVCVFCGSSSGKRECYREAALELGQELVAKRLDLVYGGGSIGLMGLISHAVHRGGGHVLGIIPRPLVGKEKTGETVGEVRMVADMHQRKAEMARHSDCFIALPGTHIITLAFIDKAVDDGFIKPSQRHIFVSATNAKELVQKLEAYEPVQDGVVAMLNWEKVEQTPPAAPKQLGFAALQSPPPPEIAL